MLRLTRVLRIIHNDEWYPFTVPASTYRLQLTPEFDFGAVAAQSDYFSALGLTHVYLSPILQAAPGSTHGYDVVDHSRVSVALGGEDGFRAMADRLRSAGLGIVVDIVPNHMAIPAPESLNRQLWSVLSEGQSSPYARWFDVDWTRHDGRLLLPILGSDSLDGITVSGDRVSYGDHVLPVRDGTSGLPLPELLDAQHYKLAFWKNAATELNYRRFFDITTLIALRVEDTEVFDETHEVIIRLVREGLIDGLRVDHVDGLADPGGYLRRLSDVTGGAWVVTEKILAAGEVLPADWACAGTTGYDAVAFTGGLATDPAGAEPLSLGYAKFTGEKRGFAEVAREAKHDQATGAFAPDLSRVVRSLKTDAPPEDLAAVVAELATCLRVYRAYVAAGTDPSPDAVRELHEAAGAARDRLPVRLHSTVQLVLDDVLAGGDIRFQQYTVPVEAKGVEDTAFYRWFRLVSLNEVGCDPGVFGLSQTDFHATAARLARDWPATMTTLSTHDTKRAEDVRARLTVLAERPSDWAAAVVDWHELLRDHQVDPAAEYLIWQTLVGAWPISAERLRDYLTKAMREAKTHTTWTDQDPVYEDAVLTFAEAAWVAAPVGDFVAEIAPDARVNSLAAKLIQLTMPGVPDVYQGCELASYALVDPDNRRPVDYAWRRELLEELDSGAVPSGLDEEKLLVTSRALRLRRDHPEWFTGSYEPVEVNGAARECVTSFCRGGEVVVVAGRLPATLRAYGGWGGTQLRLPDGDWRDALTGDRYEGLPALRLPVALLVRS
jgi:(1->4)-alpha-D-glucan 1-alpha-D-glucosylmutase